MIFVTLYTKLWFIEVILYGTICCLYLITENNTMYTQPINMINSSISVYRETSYAHFCALVIFLLYCHCTEYWIGSSSSAWHHGPLLLFYLHGLTLTPAWINDYIHYKVWDGITYPFPNINGSTVEVWEWNSNFTPHFIGMWLLIHTGVKVKPY